LHSKLEKPRKTEKNNALEKFPVIIRENNTPEMKSGAEYSPCEQYRYRLWRIWDERRPACAFIGLNPSTATELVLDRTVTRCFRFAQGWGYGGLHMLNIFAYRATYPEDMYACADPVGGERADTAIVETVGACGLAVAAWGNHGLHLGRGEAVRALVPKLHALRITGGGFPSHPLYLPGNLKPRPWV